MIQLQKRTCTIDPISNGMTSYRDQPFVFYFYLCYAAVLIKISPQYSAN